MSKTKVWMEYSDKGNLVTVCEVNMSNGYHKKAYDLKNIKLIIEADIKRHEDTLEKLRDCLDKATKMQEICDREWDKKHNIKTKGCRHMSNFSNLGQFCVRLDIANPDCRKDCPSADWLES